MFLSGLSSTGLHWVDSYPRFVFHLSDEVASCVDAYGLGRFLDHFFQALRRIESFYRRLWLGHRFRQLGYDLYALALRERL